FWRRWHMTLGTWFREYVYIPLGGNRKGKKRMYINMLIVWTLTGFWHGADWNFILWGMLLFCLLSAEKTWYGKYLEKHRALGHLYMLFWIPMSWLLFAITDMKQFGIYFSKLWGFGEAALMPTDYLKYFGTYGKWLIIGLIFCTALPENIYKMMLNRQKYQFAQFFWMLESVLIIFAAFALKKWWILLLIVPVVLREYLYVQMPKQRKPQFNKIFWAPELLLIFGLSVYCIYRGMNDPFLYFRF
nr:hypothetical protein [Oscillospiraceae bacterium]